MKKIALIGGRLGEKINAVIKGYEGIEATVDPSPKVYYDIALISSESDVSAEKFRLAVLLGEVSGERYEKLLRDKDIITCGMTSTDTVTLSSITKKGATLCIQRKINAFGNKILPAEYNISFSHPINPTVILAAGLILILTKFPNENEVPILLV